MLPRPPNPPSNMHAIELMNRLHALDAALATCQRQAITVDELRGVWELHSAGLERPGGNDGEWVDVLLRRMAARHGIAGLVTFLPEPVDPEDGAPRD